MLNDDILYMKYIVGIPEGQERDKEAEKKFWRNNCQKRTKFNEKHEWTHLSNPTNPKQRNPQTLKDKEKIFKKVQKKSNSSHTGQQQYY